MLEVFRRVSKGVCGVERSQSSCCMPSCTAVLDRSFIALSLCNVWVGMNRCVSLFISPPPSNKLPIWDRHARAIYVLSKVRVNQEAPFPYTPFGLHSHPVHIKCGVPRSNCAEAGLSFKCHENVFETAT